ncbi:DUF2085 domain-containing protein [Rhodothermus profundi]|uniref:Uncharacterized membrane protein n=1 Tax=Rhodothermus profundi TaxID=633813 RepID=A0A1M6PB45_9BACT|nr:DUF2085 domain-containing protein [Rhodothermus profundi]SHK05090.1 Uncharacterized membrane protein [Rhodothermus profundi]
MALQSNGGRYVALGVSGLLLLLVSLPPFVSPSARALLMAAFAPLCHQLPDRSFWIDGVQLAVCQRCYGIYTGLFLGALLLPMFGARAAWMYRQARWLLVVALFPPALDWGLQILQLWNNTPLSRTLTGLWFGLVVGLLLTATLCHAPRKAPPQPA